MPAYIRCDYSGPSDSARKDTLKPLKIKCENSIASTKTINKCKPRITSFEIISSACSHAC